MDPTTIHDLQPEMDCPQGHRSASPELRRPRLLQHALSGRAYINACYSQFNIHVFGNHPFYNPVLYDYSI